MELLDPELVRQEAIGAFVHEVRTPLTSMRMVLEIGKRAAADGRVVLDAELIQMMETSMLDLQRLTDGLQEMSRLERGRLALRSERTSMTGILGRASALSGIVLAGEGTVDVTGEWDGERLAVALGGMAAAANRCGAGDGVVRCATRGGPTECELFFESGIAGGAAKPIDADLGHSFFRGHALIGAMAGTIAVQREVGYLGLRVRVPTSAVR